jgi:hypothetical protein
MGGRQRRDYAGGAGGVLLASSLTSRIFAPFGVRDVDMKELEAHLTDALALVPPQKLPQIIAETAAGVKEHFKEKAPNYGEIYDTLVNGLYRYHRIAVPASTAAFEKSHVDQIQQTRPTLVRSI